MKNIPLAGLVTALVLVSPVSAHTLDVRESRGSTNSAFAGVRLRIALARAQPVEPSLDLTLTSMLRNQSSDGRSSLRWCEGVSLGIAGERRSELWLAGHPIGFGSRHMGNVDTAHRNGLSILGTVAVIGVGVAALAGLAYVAAVHADDEGNCDNRC